MQRDKHFTGEDSELKSIWKTYVEEALLDAFNAEFSIKKDRVEHQEVSIFYEFSQKQVETITFKFGLDDYPDDYIDCLCSNIRSCPKSWN